MPDLPASIRESALAEIEEIRAEEHPVAVYLAGLSPSSRRTMRGALDTIAQIGLGHEKATAWDVPWHLMSAEEYQEAASVGSISGQTVPAGRALSDGELAGLLDTCEQEPLGIRDAAMISLLYGCGLRRAELVALDMGDYSKNWWCVARATRGGPFPWSPRRPRCTSVTTSSISSSTPTAPSTAASMPRPAAVSQRSVKVRIFTSNQSSKHT